MLLNFKWKQKRKVLSKTAENLNPALDLLKTIPLADTFKQMFGKKQIEAKEVKTETTDTFEEVK